MVAAQGCPEVSRLPLPMKISPYCPAVRGFSFLPLARRGIILEDSPACLSLSLSLSLPCCPRSPTMPPVSRWPILGLVVLAGYSPAAEPPLHQRIDELILAAAKGKPASPPADDG